LCHKLNLENMKTNSTAVMNVPNELNQIINVMNKLLKSNGN